MTAVAAKHSASMKRAAPGLGAAVRLPLVLGGSAEWVAVGILDWRCSWTGPVMLEKRFVMEAGTVDPAVESMVKKQTVAMRAESRESGFGMGPVWELR